MNPPERTRTLDGETEFVAVMFLKNSVINPMFAGFAFLMMPVAQKVINSRFAIDTAKMEVIEDGLEREN